MHLADTGRMMHVQPAPDSGLAANAVAPPAAPPAVPAPTVYPIVDAPSPAIAPADSGMERAPRKLAGTHSEHDRGVNHAQASDEHAGLEIAQTSAQTQKQQPDLPPAPAPLRPYEPAEGKAGAGDSTGNPAGSSTGTEAETMQTQPMSGLADIAYFEQLAMENNPSIQQAAAIVHKAYGARRQTGLYPNPAFGYVGNEIGDLGSAGWQGAYLQQQFVTKGKLQLNKVVADQTVHGATWQLEAQRRRVRTATRIKFYEALGAQRRLEQTLRLRQLGEQAVDSARALVQAQQSSRVDLLQAQTQLNRIEIAVAEAQAQRDATRRQLAMVCGFEELPPVELAGALECDDCNRTWEVTLDTLLSNNPQLQQVYMQIQRARALIRRQEVQPFPNVTAQLQVQQDTSSGYEAASLQVTVPLPLFNHNEGNIDEAYAEYVRSSRNARRQQLELQNALADAFGRLQASIAAVQNFRETLVPLAEETLELTEDGYDLGEFDYLRVLTVRRNFIETNLDYIDSMVELRRSLELIDGLVLNDGFAMPTDVDGDSGLRGQALSGQ